MLVMPPSFPYGGMENPRLTFLTPAVLAGDRSLDRGRRARAGALVDRQPGHQRERRALLAQRGLDHVCRAAHRRSAVGRGRRRARVGARAGASSTKPCDASSTWPGRPDATADAPRGRRPRRRVLDRAVREGRVVLAAPGAGRRPSSVRRVHSQVHRGVPLRRAHHGGLSQLCRAASGSQSRPTPGCTRRACRSTAPAPRSERLEAIERLDGSVPASDQASGWTATEWQIYLDSLSDATPTRWPKSIRASS